MKSDPEIRVSLAALAVAGLVGACAHAQQITAKAWVRT